MAVRWNRFVGGALVGGTLLLPSGLAAQRASPEVQARVWLDRGAEPTLARGETARLYYRASRDAFVAIFQIDTDGSARMVFPRSPEESNLVRGGLDYRLLFARSSFWQVDEDPGVGYFFLIASPTAIDFSVLRYSTLDRGWDLSRVGREIYKDPYVAMDDFVAALVPYWQAEPYALDFVTYHVGGRFEFPRFLCYECHAFRPFAAWNPYAAECADVRMLIYDDPYYYPATRYRADRVVYARPLRPFEPRFAFKERTAGEPAGPLTLSAARRSTAGIGSGGVPGGTASGAGRPSGAEAPGRPSAAVGGASGRVAPPAANEERSRPVLQPRPSPDPAGARPSGAQDGRAAPPTSERPDTRPSPTAPPPGSRPDLERVAPPPVGGSRPSGQPAPATTRPGPPPPGPRPPAR